MQCSFSFATDGFLRPVFCQTKQTLNLIGDFELSHKLAYNVRGFVHVVDFINCQPVTKAQSCFVAQIY